MDIERLIIVAGVFLVSSTLQSTVGFGFSLLASPLLLLFDIPLAQAVALCIIGSTAQRTMAVIKLRDYIDVKKLMPLFIFMLLGLPLGILILRRLTFLPPDRIKQSIGVLIIIVLAVRWAIKVEPRKTVHKVWGILAGFSAGILSGIANIPGPPIVLWILAHDWPNQKMRVTSLALSLALVPIQLFLMWQLLDGADMRIAGREGLMTFPAALIGSALGLVMGNRLSTGVLRISAQFILLIIALTAIVQPFLR